MKRALLLSASSYKDSGYLNHCKGWIKEFLGGLWEDEILFIPFAGVRRTSEQYEQKVADCLESNNIRSIHHFSDMKAAVKNAKSICIGGGNTFVLLNELYKFDLLGAIKDAVDGGALYFGWSAGANVAGKTMMTTNDMPIVFPPSPVALGIFPYQINPHFISGKISNHNGESREERLEEFLIVNQNDSVYAMPEGSAFLINGNECEVMGHADVLKFEYKKEISRIAVGGKFKI